MAALGYDSAMILADAIKRAGATDGAKVPEDALAADEEFPLPTASSNTSSPARHHDDEPANRNASKPAVVIVTIKNGA
jgi:branched-chain amino acid transport system substrate-binding protein